MTILDESQSPVTRRYGDAPSLTSEVDRMTKSYAPTFRSKLDNFVMNTADKFMGKDRKAPERELYWELHNKNDDEKS